MEPLGSLASDVPVALAYMGPGAGLAAFGAVLTLAAMLVFMAVGFVWYPLLRLRAAWRRRRGKEAPSLDGDTKSDGEQEIKRESEHEADRAGRSESPAMRYSAPDRFLHRLAFATVPVQKALADLEDRLYAGRIADVRIERPVFIASLPRAGTTLLLETLYASRAFAAHTYRNVPFLFIPLLWNQISRRFRLSGGHVERAHGDGMTIGYDSAEAFEEALWRAFHRQQYLPDRIRPWADDDDFASAAFDAFIKNHCSKLIALRILEMERLGVVPAEDGERPRYLSKNNGNLSRLPKIARLFPDATLLVPLRNPVDHVASLLRTHLRFQAMHGEGQAGQGGFARRYMADIGHFDFGANLRPIDFDQWLDDAPSTDAGDASFWLSYWCAAFEHVRGDAGEGVVLVDYDGLCAQPARHLARIAAKTSLAEAALAPAAPRFQAPKRYEAATLGLDRVLLDRALELHCELLARTLD